MCLCVCVSVIFFSTYNARSCFFLPDAQCGMSPLTRLKANTHAVWCIHFFSASRHGREKRGIPLSRVWGRQSSLVPVCVSGQTMSYQCCVLYVCACGLLSMCVQHLRVFWTFSSREEGLEPPNLPEEEKRKKDMQINYTTKKLLHICLTAVLILFSPRRSTGSKGVWRMDKRSLLVLLDGSFSFSRARCLQCAPLRSSSSDPTRCIICASCSE